MAEYSFSNAQRYAVFKTHGDRCYMDGEPIDLLSFQVDHVIPESLADDPVRLGKVLKCLGRPSTFELNSYENWLPACAPCNIRKRALVWEPSLLVQRTLQNAAAKADEARAAEKDVLTKQKLGRAVNTLMRAHEDGGLSDDVKKRLQPIVYDIASARPAVSRHEVVRLTPDYAVPLFDVLSDDGSVRVVRGPFGMGGGPSSGTLTTGCSVCGYNYFNGARCVICGNLEDGD